MGVHPRRQLPLPGQESVWDYPRPPAVVPDGRSIEVTHGERLIARSTTSVRVLETSHPPAFYVPPDAVVPGRLVLTNGSSHCEWKGAAEYLAVEGTVEPVAWRYPTPYPEFSDHAGWVSFYPGRVDCTVNDEPVRPQAEAFTAAGSPMMWSARSRASQAPRAGKHFYRRNATATHTKDHI